MNVSNYAGIYIGIVVGVVIGAGFAWLQLQALRRNELLEKQEHVPTLMRQIPGSMSRCAVLLMALVLAQVLFPKASLTWMSAGFLTAYALPFLYRLRIKYLRR